MRGRKLTLEEMECPEELLETDVKRLQYSNYALLYLPTEVHRGSAKKEADYRRDDWDMPYTVVQEEDYLSALISFMRSVYEDAKKGKQPYHYLLIECNFEEEYMDWLRHGMEPYELLDFVKSLNGLIQPILGGLEFVKIHEGKEIYYDFNPKTGKETSYAYKVFYGIVEMTPTIYESMEQFQKVKVAKYED